MSEENPCASQTVVTSPAAAADQEFQNRIDGRDQSKLHAIIKDAEGFWLTIILCFLSFAIACPFVAAAYARRLNHWSYLAKKYPELLASGVPRNSIQARFKAARWKLVAGLSVVSVVFVGLFVWFISV